MIDTLPHTVGLVAALSIGFLIGLERGWRDREISEGGRVAGLRTFTLTGLLGGLLATLMDDFGAWPLLGGLIGVALLLAVSYREAARTSGNLSITSAVAMLLTLVLGALAVRGAVALALAAAVIVAVLLDLKSTLHRWLRLIEHRELTAALQLLVLSVVILPNLPDTGFGPYAALNPYRLWWAVVLIAGLSMAGHLAMRLTGPQRGILWTGLLGGLASSTAATLALARQVRDQPALAGAAASAALGACGVMFFRMTVLVLMLQPGLARGVALPLLAAGLALLALCVQQWRRLPPAAVDANPAAPQTSMRPFDLTTALGFGAFLAVMAVLVPAAKQWLGTGGIYALSALSALADVDAIVISLAHLHGDGGLSVAATFSALGLAALSNMVTKACMAWITGGRGMGLPVLQGYLLACVVGGASAALLHWS